VLTKFILSVFLFGQARQQEALPPLNIPSPAPFPVRDDVCPEHDRITKVSKEMDDHHRQNDIKTFSIE
jgi:hypothetical protein